MSGTITFRPPLADILVDVFERLEIEATAISATHYISARRSMNLIQSDFSNLGVNLWRMELVSTTLVQGTATYDVAASVVDVLDTYLTTTVDATTTDLMLYPISRNDYAALPQKTQQARPTSYWFNKSPASGVQSITLWPVPDGNGPYVMNAWSFLRLADADPSSGGYADVPHEFYRAYVSAVAADMAIKWKPAKFDMLSKVAAASWLMAAAANTERVSGHISPQLDAYFS